MDQGASQAIWLAEVPNRRYSGDIEVSLKRFVADVTNWRKMLSGTPKPVDLVKMKEELSTHVPKELKKYILPDNKVTEINYPVTKYPVKIKSVKLEKLPVIEGILLGIKGQYLLLDDDRVFNVRSHEGFISEFIVEEHTQKVYFNLIRNGSLACILSALSKLSTGSISSVLKPSFCIINQKYLH